MSSNDSSEASAMPEPPTAIEAGVPCTVAPPDGELAPPTSPREPAETTSLPPVVSFSATTAAAGEPEHPTTDTPATADASSAATGDVEPSAAAVSPSAVDVSADPSDVDVGTPPAAAPAQAPTILSIEPNHGPLTGTSMTVQCVGFAPGCVVHVGGVVAPATGEGGVLVVTVPPRATPGSVDVRIVNPDSQSDLRVHGFHYDAPPSIARAEPAALSSTTGGDLWLFGRFFEGATVWVGGEAIAAVSAEPDCIRIVAPPKPEGIHEVSVLNPDGQRATVALRFAEGPIITSVTPAESPLAGGVTITIEGRGFSPGCSLALFGTHSPAVTADGPTRLRFTAPPFETEGVGPLRIQNPDGLGHTLPDAFRYRIAAPPRIDAVSPSRGSIGGSTRVTITGAGFDAKCATYLGTTKADATYQSPEVIIVVTAPVSSPSAVDLRVENPDGQSVTLAGGFTFTPPPAPPKLLSLSPARGFTSGGATINVIGDNFDENTLVRIGEVRTTVRFVSRTLLEAHLPPRGEPGPVAVELEADGVVVRSEDAFVYETRPAPRITGVSPNNGFTTGGTKVIIEGADFPDDVYVRVGREAAKSIASRRHDQIIVVTPPAKAAGMVDIEVGGSETAPAIMKNAFRYDARPAPLVTSVSPTRGAVAGNTEISISGKHFLAESTVLVGGKPATKVKLADPGTLEAKTPPGKSGEMVDVVVRNPDGKEAVAKRAFLYDERYR